jgi:hypothetical protein
MKLGLLAASLVLVASGAAGCGGDDSSGSNAKDAPSTATFCGALKGFQDDLAAADPSTDLTAYITTLKDAADTLDDVGTPDDMSADAKDGFAITVKRIKDVPSDATSDDLAGMGDVSAADKTKLDALDDYITKNCPDLGDGTGSTDSGSGSSSPSPS